MSTPLFKLTAITFLIISSSSLGSFVIAETEPGTSSDVLSEPINDTEALEGTAPSEAEPVIRPTSQDEFNTITSPSNSIEFEKVNPSTIKVNPRSQQWETINTGDSNRGTVEFKVK